MNYLFINLKMYKIKKVTPEVYGFVKANLDNGVSYAKTIKLLFKNFKVKLGNTTLMLINRSWDFDNYCLINKRKREGIEAVEPTVKSDEDKKKESLEVLIVVLVVVVGLFLYKIFGLL